MAACLDCSACSASTIVLPSRFASNGQGLARGLGVDAFKRLELFRGFLLGQPTSAVFLIQLVDVNRQFFAVVADLAAVWQRVDRLPVLQLLRM